MNNIIEEKHFNSQPFFVVTDDSYKRMYQSLKSGEKSVKTYITTCPHSKKSDCKCPSFKNILIDNQIHREFNGQTKPVFSISEYQKL